MLASVADREVVSPTMAAGDSAPTGLQAVVAVTAARGIATDDGCMFRRYRMRVAVQNERKILSSSLFFLTLSCTYPKPLVNRTNSPIIKACGDAECPAPRPVLHLRRSKRHTPVFDGGTPYAEKGASQCRTAFCSQFRTCESGGSVRHKSCDAVNSSI